MIELRHLRLWLLFLLLPLMSPLMASDLASHCLSDAVAPVRILEDPTGELSAEQVMALPEARFQVLETSAIPIQFSHSAFWIRFSITAPPATFCEGWLSAGAPGMDDVRLYVRRGHALAVYVTGLAHPVEAWANVSRHPLFPLALEPGETLQAMLRVSSQGALRIQLRLIGGLDLVQREERAVLIEGFLLGLVALVIPFSLVVGIQIRSALLLLGSMAVLPSVLLACITDGFLAYWPSFLDWSGGLLTGAGSLMHLSFALYLAMLFKLNRMPAVWRIVLCLVVLVPGALTLVGSGIGYSISRQWIAQLESFYGVVVPIFGLVAWRLGLRIGWLGWALVGLFGAQGLVDVFSESPISDWPLGVDRNGLISTGLGIVLLVATLIQEFFRSRQRERFALARLESQQHIEKTRLERMVARRTTLLRDSLRSRSVLLARISHDLRSPLAGIVDYARHIRHQNSVEYSDSIERNARRQLDRIDELLEFSRSQLQQQELVVAPGYLFSFLTRVEDQSRFLLQRSGSELDCRFAGDLPPVVHADFRRLERVLINLIEVAARGFQGGRLLFDVGRTGESAGIADLRFTIDGQTSGDALLSHSQVFRDSSGAEDLAITSVRQCLGQMGSELLCSESPVSYGFNLALTIADENELDLLMDESASATLDGDGLRVLIVDDVACNREVMSDLLAGYGFDVFTAEEGAQGLCLLQQENVDLVITDQMMPGLDGWSLLAALRERNPELPVLLYSAVPPNRPVGLPPDLSFDAVLLKPAEGGALLGQVARLVGSSSGQAL